MNEGPDFLAAGATVHLQITFTLHIPQRIQAEVTKHIVGNLRTFTDNFIIKMRYTYFAPVAIVVPLNPTRPPRPSDAVIVVREFLKRAISERPESPLRFETLGPSPFHCDFQVEPGAQGPDQDQAGIAESEDQLSASAFECIETSGTGYDSMQFTYHPMDFETPTAAAQALIEEIEEELGLYYEIVQTQSEKLTKWQAIIEQTDSLTKLQQGTGPRAMWHRWTSHRLVANAYIALAQYEADSVFSNAVLKQHYDVKYRQSMPTYFRRHIDEELAHGFTPSMEAATRIVELADKRQTQRIDILALLISSLLGGAIGSLLTLVVAR